jgi:putative nucleotidyltransferase with HDIG domain
MFSPVSRPQAWSLLTEWVDSESLRRHCLAVEASMVAYARRFGEDEELWAATGLLHDADYERHPDMSADGGHPRTIIAELRRRDAPPEMIDAIAGHAPYLGVSRETLLARTLFAVDELAGFVLACAAVRPERLRGMAPSSVKKKLKQASFAAAVDRDEVRSGAAELGVDFDEHLTVVIGALAEREDRLGMGASRPLVPERQTPDAGQLRDAGG